LDGKVPYEVDRLLAPAINAAARDAAASGLAEPVVLLSPACASFDQYPNFEVRGKAFTEAVLAIPGVAATVNAS
jgi:UDP-N-acetylmuramoylalanine--D-glutamate ligase